MREILFVTVAAAAASALLVACDSPRDELTRDEISTSARDLRQLASDAQLLVSERAKHHVTDNFTWVHQKALGDESLKLAERVAKPVPPKLRSDYDAFVALNSRFGAEVRGVSTQPATDELAQRFADLAAESQALEGKR